MKGCIKLNMINFVRMNENLFYVFNKSKCFYYQGEKVLRNNDNDSDNRVLKDLSSLSNLISSDLVFKEDLDYIQFIKEYPSNQIFYLFHDKQVYEAIEFIDRFEIVGNNIKRKIRVLGISPFDLKEDVSDKNRNIFNFPSLDRMLDVRLEKSEDINKLLKQRKMKLIREENKRRKKELRIAEKREANRRNRDRRQRIIYENEKRQIEYEIMMNGKILTPKFKEEKYRKFTISVIEKYNKVHPMSPIYLNGDTKEITKQDKSSKIEILNKDEHEEKMIKGIIEEKVNEKINVYKPEIEDDMVYGYSSLSKKDIIGRIELVDKVYGFNRHLHHKFDKNGVVKKFAFKDKNGVIKLVELSVFYCETCNIYFDYMESYKSQLRKAGISIASVIATHVNQYGDVYDFDNHEVWQEQSILKLFGYSVGYSGKSVKERRRILRFLLDSQLMTADEMKRYLNHFITYNGEKYGNEIARMDWINDLDYINDYLKKMGNH